MLELWNFGSAVAARWRLRWAHWFASPPRAVLSAIFRKLSLFLTQIEEALLLAYGGVVLEFLWQNELVEDCLLFQDFVKRRAEVDFLSGLLLYLPLLLGLLLGRILWILLLLGDDGVYHQLVWFVLLLGDDVVNHRLVWFVDCCWEDILNLAKHQMVWFADCCWEDILNFIDLHFKIFYPAILLVDFFRGNLNTRFDSFQKFCSEFLVLLNFILHHFKGCRISCTIHKLVCSNLGLRRIFYTYTH